MKKHLIKLSLLTLAVALLGSPAALRAQDTTATNAPAAEAPVKKKAGGLRFHGKISALDATAGTLTVDIDSTNLNLTVSEKTKIKKNGATATLADLAVGDLVHGAYKKAGDKQVATTLTIGGKKKAEDSTK